MEVASVIVTLTKIAGLLATSILAGHFRFLIRLVLPVSKAQILTVLIFCI